MLASKASSCSILNPGRLRAYISLTSLGATQYLSSRSSPTDATAHTKPKPFSSLPGRLRLPFLGSLWDMILLPWNWSKPIHVLQLERMKKYGQIYREKFPVYGEMVVVHQPSDVENFFRAEGKNPKRLPLEMLIQARKDMGVELGVSFSEGESWRRQRAPMSKFAMIPQKVAEFHEGFNVVTADLVRNIYNLRDPNTFLLPDMVSHMYRWTFENSALFVFGNRLGCLDDPIPTDCKKWIDLVQDVFFLSEKVAMGPSTYKYIPTKSYRMLKDSVWKLAQLAISKAKEKIAEFEQNEEQTLPDQMDLLTYLMKYGEMSIEEVAENSVDMIIAAVDTTTVMCNEAVTGRLPELFDEPECYRPERWDKKNKEPPHAFASLPFGYGPRMCLGRRLVELEMQIALVHIIRVFQLTYHEEELGMKQRLLNVPDRSVDITFDDLHDHI